MVVIKTREEVKAEFDRQGISVAEWARSHGLDRATVYSLLSGKKTAAKRGKAHNAAVLLGLKNGTVVQPKARSQSASKPSSTTSSATA